MSEKNHPKQEEFLDKVNQHKGIIYKVVHAYTNNDADREDLIQEITLQLWSSYNHFDNNYKFSTWMYRIALNVAISSYRKQKVRSKHLSGLEADSVYLTIADAEDKSEELQLMQSFIQNLNKVNKALMLLYLDEHSHAEIAQLLGMSVSNVGTKIGRLKKQLLDYLKKHLS